MYRAIDSYVTQPEVADLEPLYDQFSAHRLDITNSTTLDIGCGETPRNPFHAKNIYGLDIREDVTKNIRYADLTTEALPYADGMFDYITAYDFLEHIPRVVYVPERRFPFIQLMNEIYRTLKPGGIFLSRTPFYPISSAFTDPTHVNVITADTFLRYFDDQFTWARMYGFEGAFRIRLQAVHVTHLVAILQKPQHA
jgi:SAM-dependent methyltransferase